MSWRRGLLDEVAATAGEPDYSEARRRPWGWRGIVAVLLIGAVMGLAVAQSARLSNERAGERTILLAKVRQAETEQKALHERAQALSEEIAQLRDEALGQGADADATRARLQALEVAAGATPVSGPGIVITLDDAPDATAKRGRVLDVDVRAVVNGLWEAGAEAISVNGQRLTPTTAIRTAGSAITVNYRSIARPYRVEAIGDRRTLEGRFTAAPGGQWLASLKTNYGVVTTTSRADLQLAAAASPLRNATKKEG